MKGKEEKAARVCAYCEHGTPAPDDGSGKDAVICKKHGLVDAASHCRRFKYDVLKRAPKARADLPEIEKIDI